MAHDGQGREGRSCIQFVFSHATHAHFFMDLTPLYSSVNCWPSGESGTSTVNLEYELEKTHLSLHNVFISVPLPPGAEPIISEQPSVGSFVINRETSSLDWTIDEVSEAAGTTTGSMEFEVDGDDTDVFFPVGVAFVSQQTLCGLQVGGFFRPSSLQG